MRGSRLRGKARFCTAPGQHIVCACERAQESGELVRKHHSWRQSFPQKEGTAMPAARILHVPSSMPKSCTMALSVDEAHSGVESCSQATIATSAIDNDHEVEEWRANHCHSRKNAEAVHLPAKKLRQDQPEDGTFEHMRAEAMQAAEEDVTCNEEGAICRDDDEPDQPLKQSKEDPTQEIKRLRREVEVLTKLNMDLQRALCAKIFRLEAAFTCGCQQNSAPSSATSNVASTPTGPCMSASTAEHGKGASGSAALGATSSGEAVLSQFAFSASASAGRTGFSLDTPPAISPHTAVTEPTGSDSSLAVQPSCLLGSASTAGNVSPMAFAPHELDAGPKATLRTKKKQNALVIQEDIDPTCGETNKAGDVHLGHGVYIDQRTWVSVMAAPADSTFCKRLAVAVWKPEVLAKRSPTGTASNKAVSKGNNTVYPALSPQKVAGISSAFWAYLESQNCPIGERYKRHKLLGRYLTQKCSDLRR
ncbi:uncharacterized protein LOC144158588 isoform X4 [Haemaphysalis longicornis]